MSQIPISTVVNVDISLEALPVSEANFGTPLIFGSTQSSWNPRIREYFTLNDVLTDFSSSNPEYKAAAAIFDQNPNVKSIKIAQQATKVAQVQEIDFSASLITGNNINGEINGVAMSQVAYNTSDGQTLTDLASLISSTEVLNTGVVTGTPVVGATLLQASSGATALVKHYNATKGTLQIEVTHGSFDTTHLVTGTNIDLSTFTFTPTAITSIGSGAAGTHKVTVTAATAGISFELASFAVSGGASHATVTIVEDTPNHGIVEDLGEIMLIDDSWYGLIYTDRSLANILQAAEYIEAASRVFYTCTNDTNALNAARTDDIAYTLKAAGYNRTACVYNATLSDYADGAIMGKEFPMDPGTYTMNLKTLEGITIDALTPTQYNAGLK